MSIYTTKQLLEEIDKMDDLTMVLSLKKIIQLPVSPTMRAQFARIIMGDEEAEKDMAKLTSDRIISLKSLMTLSESPIMEYVRPLIEAALDPRGPFDTKDVMLIAAEKKGIKAFYITADGIPQNYKNQVGYILSMAGFERVSHYDRHTKRPIKAWKSKYGYGHLSANEREVEVAATMSEQLNQTVKAATPAPKSNLLENFL